MKKTIIKTLLTLTITLSLALVFFIPKRSASAASSDYTNKTLFVPYAAVQYLNFTTNQGPGAYNIGTMWIYAQYTYTPNVTANVYAYGANPDKTMNGLCYRGGGSLHYLTYINGSYQHNYWTMQQNYFNYIIIKFMQNLPSITSDLTDLLSNGAQFIEGNPNENAPQFYAFLGGYLASKDYKDSRENTIREILQKPHDFGLYTEDELINKYDEGYADGSEESGSAAFEFSNVMKSAFNGAANLLNVQIFPNITIGLIIGLPLLLGLFLIVLKLIRG